MLRYSFVTTAHIPPDTRRVSIYGGAVDIDLQRTGFGYKRLFICPRCGERRAKLVIHNDGVYCRGCVPFDIYAYRRNMYDEGGQRLIEWHMKRIADKAGLSFKYPFKYIYFLEDILKLTPAKQDAYRDILVKLQMLENMRFSAIFFGRQFTAKHIREYTNPAYTERFTLYQLMENCYFT